MKTSELTFMEGFTDGRGQRNRKEGVTQKVFDWDKCAGILKERLKNDPNLYAEAGLEGDWDHTGGTIYASGNTINDSYLYLSSNWAIPTLIINDEEEIECFCEAEGSRFTSDSKWDEESIGILTK